ncbi:L,D-transpeptidase family protein [Novosphingobium sp. KCTC 2891]|uniref:L,D-transpeptidase family protein n=1 Tax=Novosphingobium sp. KCTC 2891 TaxID=2989730 RepID=UPI00222382D6|nr:L,D-transpeptidase family protein [Novosphingobium sp. KCTC 2891]MCW1382512.1 L,D-transpeptidase family protein [Novosphingobium sp. KCTC 2891]
MRRLLLPLGLVLAADGAAASVDPGQAEPPAAGSVLIEKAARRLTLFDSAGHAMRTYSGIQLGDAPAGPKRFEGDERTPEGRYVIDYGNADSAYHLSLHISYPDSRDVAFAHARGRSPGGLIFIHGQPNGFQGQRMPGDWTDGCIALSNEQIEEIWSMVADGTPIDIKP